MAEQHPADERAEPEQMHGRSVELGRTIGEPHVAPARLLGHTHQPRDIRKERILLRASASVSSVPVTLIVPE